MVSNMWQEIKRLEPRSAGRKEAIDRLLEKRDRFIAKVAWRAEVSESMVSKVLNGSAVSAKVETAIEAELKVKSRAA